jgi:hypothetical protein
MNSVIVNSVRHCFRFGVIYGPAIATDVASPDVRMSISDD